jgi:hypothetical protein
VHAREREDAREDACACARACESVCACACALAFGYVACGCMHASVRARESGRRKGEISVPCEIVFGVGSLAGFRKPDNHSTGPQRMRRGGGGGRRPVLSIGGAISLASVTAARAAQGEEQRSRGPEGGSCVRSLTYPTEQQHRRQQPTLCPTMATRATPRTARAQARACTNPRTRRGPSRHSRAQPQDPSWTTSSASSLL